MQPPFAGLPSAACGMHGESVTFSRESRSHSRCVVQERSATCCEVQAALRTFQVQQTGRDRWIGFAKVIDGTTADRSPPDRCDGDGGLTVHTVAHFTLPVMRLLGPDRHELKRSAGRDTSNDTVYVDHGASPHVNGTFCHSLSATLRHTIWITIHGTGFCFLDQRMGACAGPCGRARDSPLVLRASMHTQSFVWMRGLHVSTNSHCACVLLDRTT
jgi:hypothetical protein